MLFPRVCSLFFLLSYYYIFFFTRSRNSFSFGWRYTGATPSFSAPDHSNEAILSLCVRKRIPSPKSEVIPVYFFLLSACAHFPSQVWRGSAVSILLYFIRPDAGWGPCFEVFCISVHLGDLDGSLVHCPGGFLFRRGRRRRGHPVPLSPAACCSTLLCINPGFLETACLGEQWPALGAAECCVGCSNANPPFMQVLSRPKRDPHPPWFYGFAFMSFVVAFLFSSLAVSVSCLVPTVA